MTIRHGQHLDLPTDRERAAAAAAHAECASKPIVRVTSAFLAKPGAAWRQVHLDPAARRATTAPAEERKHKPEGVDPVTGMRNWYVQRAKAIPERDLHLFLAAGPADRADFMRRFNACCHVLMALVRLGRVVVGKRKGKARTTGRGCMIGYVALPGQEVAA